MEVAMNIPNLIQSSPRKAARHPSECHLTLPSGANFQEQPEASITLCLLLGVGITASRRASFKKPAVQVSAVDSRRQLLSYAGLAILAPSIPSFAAERKSAPDIVRELWGSGLSTESIDKWLEAFAEDCVYEDLYYNEPVTGRSRLSDLLAQKVLPKDSAFLVDRVSDGKLSCGFTWHIEQKGVGIGQRGVAFVRLDPSTRKIAYVREVGEPLFKAGELTEKLLQALTQGQTPPPPKPPSGPPQTPTTAGTIVKYLYRDVQQSGGDAIRFYSNDVVYEDMNYEKPFVGKAAVGEFLQRFQDIQGVTFVLEEVSDGDQAVGFTYNIDIAGQPRGIKGATFYEVDNTGKVIYVRDVPESAQKPPPVQFIARALRPGLRKLQPSEPLPGDLKHSS